MLDLDRQNTLREQYRRRQPNWQPATEFYADLVRSKLGAASQVLDLGCGRGGLIEQLDHPLKQVIGIDPDVRSLQEHRLFGEMPLTAALSDDLPFPNGCFDIVFASWVLEHLSQPQRIIAEIGRVLKPGGVFIFITPNKRHPLIGFNRLINRFSTLQDQLVALFYGRKATDTFPAYYRANSCADLRQLASDLEMTLIVCQLIPDPTYLVLRPAWFKTAVCLDERLGPHRAIHIVGMIEKAVQS